MGVRVEELGPQKAHSDAPAFLQAIRLIVYEWGAFESVFDVVQNIAIHISHKYGQRQKKPKFL
jgi:hypothetical protein